MSATHNMVAWFYFTQFYMGIILDDTRLNNISLVCHINFVHLVFFIGGGGANPALPVIKPTKKKKKKKTPRSPKEPDAASMDGEDPFFSEGKSGSPEPLSVM